MDLRHSYCMGAILFMALTLCDGSSNTLEPVKSAPLFSRAIVPVSTVPMYVAQQPVYYYYPQAQYPNTGVVYRTPTTGVQYPYYGWSNTPSYKPSVPATPTNTNGVHHTGDPNNPKNDVEYIY